MSEALFFRYRDSVNALLLDYQWIEELLRIVISASYEAIRRANPRGVSFRPSRHDLEKDALGVLIQKYGQLSPHDQLVVELKALVSSRNHCAHRSFVLSIEEQNDVDFLGSEIARMARLKERTTRCVAFLQGELNEFASRLNESPQTTAERGIEEQEP